MRQWCPEEVDLSEIHTLDDALRLEDVFEDLPPDEPDVDAEAFCAATVEVFNPFPGPTPSRDM